MFCDPPNDDLQNTDSDNLGLLHRKPLESILTTCWMGFIVVESNRNTLIQQLVSHLILYTALVFVFKFYIDFCNMNVETDFLPRSVVKGILEKYLTVVR